MRRAVFLGALFIALFFSCAKAESTEKILSGIDFEAVQEISDEADAGINVMELAGKLLRGDVSIDVDEIFDRLVSVLKDEFFNLTGFFLALVLPMLVWALIQRLSDGTQTGARAAAGYVCYLSTASALIYAYSRQLSLANSAISNIQSLTEQLFPILTALLVASGATTTAAVFTPVASLVSGAVLSGIYRFAFTLLGCAAALVIAGNMNERMPLRGMSGLFLSVSNWLMGIAMSAFLGYVTVSGVLSSGYDGITVRTAQYTVDNLLPIIGGEVADTIEVALKSVVVVKNAVGITGVVLVLSFCFLPIIRMVAALITLKLATALVEPLADGQVYKLVEQFSSVLVAVLVLLVAAVVIFLSLVGALVTAGGSIVR